MGSENVRIVKPKPQDPEVLKLIEESTKDPFLGDIARERKYSDIRVFYSKNDLVGFAIPRRDSDGRYRTGAIYVTPSRRREGIAGNFVKVYFNNRKGRAYIENSNRPSQTLFKSAGFSKSGKTLKDSEGVIFEEWLKG